MKKDGFFITLEGPEGAGKSTLATRLSAYLEGLGFTCVKTREPGGTPFAEKLRTLVKGYNGNEAICPETELLLIEAARAQHVSQKIIPALNSGKIVLCDRFTDSTMAYQGGARGIDTKTIEFFNFFATGNCLPDIVFLIDLDPEIGFSRTQGRDETQGDYDRFELEGLDFHRAVRERYLKLAAESPERFIVIDGKLDRDKIIESAIAQLCENDLWKKFIEKSNSRI